MTNQLERLLLRLQQMDMNLSPRDFELLSDMDRAQLACFCDSWDSVPAEVRRGLVAAMALLAEQSFEYSFDGVFKEVLSDPDPDVRHKAVQGLWECEDESLAGVFLHMLEGEPDETVRAAVASGLGRFVYLAELDELEPALATAIETALFTTIHNPDVPIEVRRRAVEAIGFSCHSELPDIIRDAYEHEYPRMRVSALFAMGRSADGRWRKIVLRELDSSDEEIRFEAVRAAGELSLREAVEPLARVLDEKDDVMIRQAAVWSLGQIGGNSAKRVLQHILANDEEDLVEVAQDALDELSFEADFPEILELMQTGEDKDFDEPGDEWDIWGEGVV